IEGLIQHGYFLAARGGQVRATATPTTDALCKLAHDLAGHEFLFLDEIVGHHANESHFLIHNRTEHSHAGGNFRAERVAERFQLVGRADLDSRRDYLEAVE